MNEVEIPALSVPTKQPQGNLSGQWTEAYETFNRPLFNYMDANKKGSESEW